jgi:flagellar protein FliJ
MSKNSTLVLKALEEIAAKEVDLAAEALAQCIRARDDALSKQHMLAGYREDYMDNLNLLLESGMGAETYRNFQNFVYKLDQALMGQEQEVRLAQQQVDLHQSLWQESQRKRLSYDVLIARSEKRAKAVTLKKDQKMMDEFAMRASTKQLKTSST